MVYAGFWRRFAAIWLDTLILSPLAFMAVWGSRQYRLFDVYYVIPGALIGLWYGVYLVKRYGATPGKRLMSLRIAKVTGEPVGLSEALLRYLPGGLMTFVLSAGNAVAMLRLTDEQYFSAPTFIQQAALISSVTPSWSTAMFWIMQVWTWSELIVMLCNKKRRALHDFVAGTVILHEPAQTAPGTAPETA